MATFPLNLENYTLLITKHAVKEFKKMEDICLSSGNFKKHDPRDVIKEHCKLMKFSKSYYYENFPFDILFQGDETFEYFRKRFKDVQYM
jgi:hypothetical protein